MAMSGYKDVTVTSYDTLRFQWWESGTQDIANNSTLVGWKLELIAGSAGYISSGYAKSWWVNVNGEYYEGTNYISIDNNTTKTLASGYTTITHNTDGTKSFSYSFAQYFGMTFAGVKVETVSGSGSGTLTTIARKANITDADNFYDEAVAVGIKYNNPAGNAVTSLQACIASTNGQTIYVPYRNISKTGTSYTFIFTDAERKALRQAVTSGNSATFAFYICTVIGGNTYYSTMNKTMTLLSYTPLINSFTVVDNNSAAVALTGDKNKLIKYVSNALATVSGTARKEATLPKAYLKCGDYAVEASQTVFDSVTSNYFKTTLVDSRGNTVSEEKTLTMIDYIPLTAKLEADIALDTTDGTKANISFTVSGNYFNGSFGKESNTLIINYELWDNTNNTSNTYELTVPESAMSNGTYRISHTITGLDYRGSYELVAWARDKINHDVYTIGAKLKAIPVFDWSETDFNFNVPVTISGKAVDYPVEQGVKDGWYYRKWNSGLAECWKTMSVSGIDMGEFNMNGYYYSGSKGVNFPFTFKQVYYTSATGGSTGNMNIIRPFGYSTTYMTYVLMGFDDISNATATVNLEAKGTWK